jgi:hypothetical protein
MAKDSLEVWMSAKLCSLLLMVMPTPIMHNGSRGPAATRFEGHIDGRPIWPRGRSHKQALQAVLWIRIRIRKNPNILAGSEFEKKVGFGYRFGFGSRHSCRMKIFCEQSKIKHLQEKNLMFFYWTNFSLTYRFHKTLWKQLEAPFRKILGQNISKRIRIRIRIRIRKTIVDPNPNPKKMSSEPQRCLQGPNALKWHGNGSLSFEMIIYKGTISLVCHKLCL